MFWSLNQNVIKPMIDDRCFFKLGPQSLAILLQGWACWVKFLDKRNMLQLRKVQRPDEMWKWSDPNYCSYHRMLGHLTRSCYELKDKLQIFIIAGALELQSEQESWRALVPPYRVRGTIGMASPTSTVVGNGKLNPLPAGDFVMPYICPVDFFHRCHVDNTPPATKALSSKNADRSLKEKSPFSP